MLVIQGKGSEKSHISVSFYLNLPLLHYFKILTFSHWNWFIYRSFFDVNFFNQLFPNNFILQVFQNSGFFFFFGIFIFVADMSDLFYNYIPTTTIFIAIDPKSQSVLQILKNALAFGSKSNEKWLMKPKPDVGVICSAFLVCPTVINSFCNFF